MLSVLYGKTQIRNFRFESDDRLDFLIKKVVQQGYNNLQIANLEIQMLGII